MLAAILTETNKPLSLQNGEWCSLKYGQVLVKVLASGICGAQLQEIRGEKGSHFPRLLGHEGCGVVQYVGEGVTTVEPGDRVVMHWRNGDGLESQSPRIRLGGEEITTGQVTTFCEFSVCSENRLTCVPEYASVELCALLGCGLSTALGTIENEANLKIGESILIIGCGGLGLNLILAAKLRRAAFICAVDVVDAKAVAAISMGADAYWNNGESSPWTAFDVIIDTSGSPDAIFLAMEHLAPSGRFVMVGQPKPGEHLRIPNGRNMFNGDGCCIKATQGGGFRPHIDIPRYIELFHRQKIDIEGIITHRFPLQFLNDGVELVKNGQAGRVLIQP